jgi:hypothetical protein
MALIQCCETSIDTRLRTVATEGDKGQSYDCSTQPYHRLFVRRDQVGSADGPIQPQHYAFLISEADFDAVFCRIREQRIQYWAGPRRSRPGEINGNDGGRGIYFTGPDGHYLEVITRNCVGSPRIQLAVRSFRVQTQGLPRGPRGADEPRAITELAGCDVDGSREEGGKRPLDPLI